ncbi:MAG: alpha/beta fold hydrolase [Verrucomicrobia bacterium]|nr:alpha/beta fold hydrolase [Verrucomicrobiota bacterium]
MRTAVVRIWTCPGPRIEQSPIMRAPLLLFALLLGFSHLALARSLPDAAALRADFRAIVAKESVPPDVRWHAPVSTNGLELRKFSYQSDRTQRVPGIMLIQPERTGLRPVVVMLHGTGGSKESVFDELVALARRGFIAVSIDGRGHGERAVASPPEGMNAYQASIFQAWKGSGEHPFFYDTVWDVFRLIDVLETSERVDPSRIGLAGISKGGIETYLAAALDVRIAAAAPLIGVQSFAWALENNQWRARINTIEPVFERIAHETGHKPSRDSVRAFYDRVVPGIDGRFDGPSMLPLIAPRPLLVVNGDSDALTPLAGVRKSFRAAEEAYRRAGTSDRAELRIQMDTPHVVTRESKQAVIDWFVLWLKPE